jgi:hypothetical protein
MIVEPSHRFRRWARLLIISIIHFSDHHDYAFALRCGVNA